MSPPDSAQPAALRIDGELTIYRAAELKAALLAPLDPGVTLEVDLAGVTELDTAGLQLLMLAKQAAQANGGALTLAGHSAAVVDVFELLGLAGWFGDPLVIAPAAR
jgi:anti-sigma B factor antagonist